MKTMKELNESFTFDWNDYRTIAPNKDKIPALEEALTLSLSEVDLTEEDKVERARLQYKLGTYYNHVERSPTKALEKLTAAKPFLVDEVESAWVENHIAFANQQLLAANVKKLLAIVRSKKEARENPEVVEAHSKIASSSVSLIQKAQKLEAVFLEGSVKIVAFIQCVMALNCYEVGELSLSADYYSRAIELYERHSLCDDQYARAKNRYAQILAAQGEHARAEKVFEQLELYWLQHQDKMNPYSARFYVSHADYLMEFGEKNPASLLSVLEKYKKAHEVLCATEGEASSFTIDIAKKIASLEIKIKSDALTRVIEGLSAQLMNLPFSAREVLIESLSTVLLREFVPMSGMTVQQHIPAKPAALEQLNELMKKEYKNSPDPRYVYQFAREATSAGVIPCYQDKNGEIYLGLIRNKRNLGMYNWSAGYTEAPLPGWRGELLSHPEEKIYYNRVKIKDSATHTMGEILEEAEGDWTNVHYDHERFQAGFKADDVTLPKTDINSFHTAARECLEEMGLDLSQFPDKKVFLISHDNTTGISQGDAPGQTGNRSHQYLVYLGCFDKAPDIKPGDDVAIADWVNVGDILRKSPTEYEVNDTPLCVYMLRGLEMGLKDLWSYLLAQASTQLSQHTGKAIARFSNPENMLAEIERYCNEHHIKIAGTNLVNFMKHLSGDLPFKTRTGKSAQVILKGMLKTADYLLSSRINPSSFLADMNEMLSALEAKPKLHNKPATLFYANDSVVSTSRSLDKTMSCFPPKPF